MIYHRMNPFQIKKKLLNAALAITECIKDTRNCQNKISSTKEMDKMLVFTL